MDNLRCIRIVADAMAPLAEQVHKAEHQTCV